MTPWFYFEWGKGDLFDPPSSLAWVTDLGFVPTLVRERIRQASILVIEANHCTEMLEKDEKGPGALNSASAAGMATFRIKRPLNSWNQWKTPVGEVFLMHLSQDCNDVNLVRERFRKLPGRGKRFATYVIDPATARPVGV